MGKESHTSRGNCDFNGDKLVGKGKREITFFKIKKFLGNVIWEKEFVKRNLRKMCPRKNEPLGHRGWNDCKDK